MWEIVYRLRCSLTGRVLARGSIKDHPTVEEAVDRLLDRVKAALLDEPIAAIPHNCTVMQLDIQLLAQPRPSGYSPEQLRAEHARLKTMRSNEAARSSGPSSPKPDTETGQSESLPPSPSTTPMGGGSSVSETTQVTSNALSTPQRSQKSRKSSSS